MSIRTLVAAFLIASTACNSARAQSSPARAPTPIQAPPTTTTSQPSPQIDPDGNDDPVADTGHGEIPAVSHFQRVGRPPLSLHRICDLTVHNDFLYAAHANSPLGSDGATITRYQPEHQPAFSVAFDWNRPGQPVAGGGAGQGFVRVHEIGGRLFVPDADPPYAGFGITAGGTEGFVYVSDSAGIFAPARGEHFHPPGTPTPEGRAGASVLPRAYHVLDVIRYRGRYYAATGSVPPGQRAWFGASPGALHVANAQWTRWTYEVDYPFPWQNGVWRLGYLVRFRDRLYAGIQDYDWREPNDYVAIDPPADSTSIHHDDLHGTRVTEAGGAQTIRWYTDEGHLYWIALEHGGAIHLRVTDDGDHWRVISIPQEHGRPVDITRFRGSLVVLTERGLYRLEHENPTLLATVDDAHSPFEVTDIFCASPLAVYRNELYTGSQRDGSLWKLVDGPLPPNSPTHH